MLLDEALRVHDGNAIIAVSIKFNRSVYIYLCSHQTNGGQGKWVALVLSALVKSLGDSLGYLVYIIYHPLEGLKYPED